MGFDESLELIRENTSNIYEVDPDLLMNMEFVAWLIAECPGEREDIRFYINEIIGIDINKDEYMQEIAENLFYLVQPTAMEEYNDPGTQEDPEEMQRYASIADNAIEILKETGYYEKIVQSLKKPIDMKENKYEKYNQWTEAIIQECTEKNFVKSERIEDDCVYNHYVMDNGLHVYIYSSEPDDKTVRVFDGESMLGDEEKRKMQRSISFRESSRGDFYNLNIDFGLGDVKSSDNMPGSISYQNPPSMLVMFLPAKAGQSISEGLEQYFSDELSEDIEEKIEQAINSTNDPELQDSYKKALEFYNKIQEIVKIQNKYKENESKKTSENQKVDDEFDFEQLSEETAPEVQEEGKNYRINEFGEIERTDEELKELERLRDKKQQLQEQQKKIAEAEKLIDNIEKKEPNIDE